jgi:TATA-box binding protein (TBP) (component of TFIID and TFIIIB)
MQKFEDVLISTKTIVIDISIDVDIKNVFKIFPVLEFPDAPPISSKKKLRKYIQDRNLSDGTIIALEYENKSRGLPIKHFRNAMTIVMIVENKYINFKLPPKGRIQITGCKFDQYAEKCVQFLWGKLQEFSTPELPLFSFHHGKKDFSAIFHVVMSNRNFDLGFHIDRQKLDQYVNTQEEFPGTSLLELTFGYTGLNIKLPCQHQNILLKTLAYIDDEWLHGVIEYNEYLKQLSPKDYAKEIDKSRKNSFLIFRSGAAIMSGLDTHHMEKDYYKFINMIQKCKPFIEDVVDEDNILTIENNHTF